ncbi:hypothetical protein BC941DRAFT_434184 [Chlamydoabsidia padenii]|nr:hypothetical protein BC941DRAFT_434184 [Chlamydoabsidia padenii]
MSTLAASTLLNAFSSKYKQPSSSSPSPSQQKRRRQQQDPEDQWAFATSCVAKLDLGTTTIKNGKERIPWKAMFKEGREKGHFWAYKDDTTVRTAYYRKKTCHQ